MNERSIKIVKAAWRRQQNQAPPKWPAWFTLGAGGLLLLAGADAFISVLRHGAAANLPEPVFGLSFGNVLILFGLAQILAGSLCLFSDKRSTSLGVAACVIAVAIAYRAGLWTAGWHHPYLWVAGWMDLLPLSPLAVDRLMAAIAAALLAGSLTALWFVAGRTQPASSADRTAEAGKYLKMSCAGCGGHIEFPAGGLGSKTSCPHCRAAIVLQMA